MENEILDTELENDTPTADDETVDEIKRIKEEYCCMLKALLEIVHEADVQVQN